MTVHASLLAAMPAGELFDQQVSKASSLDLSKAPNATLKRIIPKMSTAEQRKRAQSAPLDLALALAAYSTDQEFLAWLYGKERRNTVRREVASNEHAPIDVICAEGTRESRRWRHDFMGIWNGQPIQRILLAARHDQQFNNRLLEYCGSYEIRRIEEFLELRLLALWPSWLGAKRSETLLCDVLASVRLNPEQARQIADAWTAMKPDAQGQPAARLRSTLARILTALPDSSEALLARYPWTELAVDLCRMRGKDSNVRVSYLPEATQADRQEIAAGILLHGGIIDRDVVTLTSKYTVRPGHRPNGDGTVSDEAIAEIRQLCEQQFDSGRRPLVVETAMQRGTPAQMAALLAIIGAEWREALNRSTIAKVAALSEEDARQLVEHAADLDPEAATWAIRALQGTNVAQHAVAGVATRLLLQASTPTSLPACSAFDGEQLRSLVDALSAEVSRQQLASPRASELLFHVSAAQWWLTAPAGDTRPLRQEVLALAEQPIWTAVHRVRPRSGSTPVGMIIPGVQVLERDTAVPYWHLATSVSSAFIAGIPPGELDWITGNAPILRSALGRAARLLLEGTRLRGVTPPIVEALIPHVPHQWSVHQDDDVMNVAFAWLQQSIGDNLLAWEVVLSLLPEWDGTLVDLVSSAQQLA